MSEVLLTHAGPVAILTLNRPERHNSLTPDFLRQMATTLETIVADTSVRTVILQANGPSFSTGGDARGFVEHAEIAVDYAQEIVVLLNQVILALVDLPCPLVVAVHGPVTGGSLGLVLASDIALVTPEASFTPYYSVVGPSPDGGWATWLPRVIGRQRATAALMLNETITAEQAVEWGLAQRIVSGEEIRMEALATASRIAGMKPGSIAHTRRLLFLDREEIATGLEAERSHFVAHMASGEPIAGFTTFLANLKAMKGLRVGQSASLSRTFTVDDVRDYRTLAGDRGLAFAGGGAEQSVPGPLLGGLFSCLLGTDLPGRGTNWLKQSLQYQAPAKVGEPVTATVEIVRLRPEKALVNLRTTAQSATGTLLCEGEALVYVGDRQVSDAARRDQLPGKSIHTATRSDATSHDGKEVHMR